MTLVVSEPGFMPSVVPCLQREAEFSPLLDLYRERKPKRVLEVGTYHGGTLYHWLQNATAGTLVISLDSYETGTDNRALYPLWVPMDVELVVIDGNSRRPHTIQQAAEHGPYDWIFIDAGHFYEEVKDDWENYGLGLVRKGGIVVFHDILYSHVARLWDEIKTEYETLEFVSDPTTEWHGIGCVFM